MCPLDREAHPASFKAGEPLPGCSPWPSGTLWGAPALLLSFLGSNSSLPGREALFWGTQGSVPPQTWYPTNTLVICIYQLTEEDSCEHTVVCGQGTISNCSSFLGPQPAPLDGQR